jgi:hypothetical protein
VLRPGSFNHPVFNFAVWGFLNFTVLRKYGKSYSRTTLSLRGLGFKLPPVIPGRCMSNVCDKAHAMILLSYVQRRIAKQCREKDIECALEESEKIKASIEEILVNEISTL